MKLLTYSMIHQGLLIMVDDTFRKTEKCSVCGELIGNEDFTISFELKPKPGVSEIVHWRCSPLSEDRQSEAVSTA